MKKLIIKYLSDIIIIVGIWIFSYNLLRPVTRGFGYVNQHTEYKVLGIILIAVGINMAIRKYFNSKNDKK